MCVVKLRVHSSIYHSRYGVELAYVFTFRRTISIRSTTDAIFQAQSGVENKTGGFYELKNKLF